MPRAPFPIIPELTGIAIAYRNRAMIALTWCLPGSRRVSPKEEFIYFPLPNLGPGPSTVRYTKGWPPAGAR